MPQRVRNFPVRPWEGPFPPSPFSFWAFDSLTHMLLRQQKASRQGGSLVWSQGLRGTGRTVSAREGKGPLSSTFPLGSPRSALKVWCNWQFPARANPHTSWTQSGPFLTLADSRHFRFFRPPPPFLCSGGSRRHLDLWAHRSPVPELLNGVSPPPFFLTQSGQTSLWLSCQETPQQEVPCHLPRPTLLVGHPKNLLIFPVTPVRGGTSPEESVASY